MTTGTGTDTNLNANADTETTTTTAATVAINYINSNHFRVIYAVGGHGYFDGEDTVRLALWNQRPQLPAREIYSLETDGNSGQNLVETSDDGSFVREVEVDVVLNRNSAESLANLLLDLLYDDDDDDDDDDLA